MKPKLLIVELWGLGDLAIATSFFKAAREKFDVTLLAKPYAMELQPRLWPEIKVVPFTAPWTAFKHKYQFWRWPWPEIDRLSRLFGDENFQYGASARWDPRDHLLLKCFRVQNRLGFPRVGSRFFLTQSLKRPDPAAHRLENWRTLATALGFSLPPAGKISFPLLPDRREVLIHSGAGQAVRVWPLERYQHLVARLRQQGFFVQVACDQDQRGWWLKSGESNVATPNTVNELLELVDRARIFIGNDSGPGHLAAACGVPTFTIFGPQLPEWFAPLHPQAEWIEGKACPYKPCSDYCRFAAPHCLQNISEAEVWMRVEKFANQHFQN